MGEFSSDYTLKTGLRVFRKARSSFRTVQFQLTDCSRFCFFPVTSPEIITMIVLLSY